MICQECRTQYTGNHQCRGGFQIGDMVRFKETSDGQNYFALTFPGEYQVVGFHPDEEMITIENGGDRNTYYTWRFERS